MVAERIITSVSVLNSLYLRHLLVEIVSEQLDK